jgi:excisionase family DNA binding protein
MEDEFSTNNKELLTPREAFDMLNISYRTLPRWVDEGKIKAVRLSSGRIRIPKKEIEKIKEDEGVDDADDIIKLLNSFINSSKERKKEYAKYAKLANEFATKLLNNTNVFISVLPSTNSNCGIACSEGLSTLGNIYLSKEFFSLPESIKEFIIAYEVAHIVKGHSITKALMSIFSSKLYNASEQLIKNGFQEYGILGGIGRILIGAILMGDTLYANSDANAKTIKNQELEAEKCAARLVRAEKTEKFIKFLELYKDDYNNISHTSLFGFPALTIDEKISNLRKIIGSGLKDANIC